MFEEKKGDGSNKIVSEVVSDTIINGYQEASVEVSVRTEGHNPRGGNTGDEGSKSVYIDIKTKVCGCIEKGGLPFLIVVAYDKGKKSYQLILPKIGRFHGPSLIQHNCVEGIDKRKQSCKDIGVCLQTADNYILDNCFGEKREYALYICIYIIPEEKKGKKAKKAKEKKEKKEKSLVAIKRFFDGHHIFDFDENNVNSTDVDCGDISVFCSSLLEQGLLKDVFDNCETYMEDEK